MENEESNVLIKVIFAVIFLGVIMVLVIIIIGALNSGNSQQGQTITSNSNDYLFRINSVAQTLGTGNLTNPACSISTVYDLSGNLISTSNYTVNNCQVTFNL